MSQSREGFGWEQADWGLILFCEPLRHIARHVFTTRQLDAGGNRADVNHGYDAVARYLGVATDCLSDARQVHGTEVFIADAGLAPPDRPCADVLVTRDPRRAVVVRAADCVPILIGDRRTGAVAAVHAGWRGTRAGAGPAAVRALTATFGSRPDELIAAIGPSIGPCCYQVGPDVVEAFGAEHSLAVGPSSAWFRPDGDRWRLDLWTANRDQLLAAGLAPDAVHVSRACTACSLEMFYSFRAEGSRAGRQLAAIRPREP